VKGKRITRRAASALKKFKEMSGRRKAVCTVAILAAAAVGVQFAGSGLKTASAAAEYTEYTVGRGNIVTSISGSGIVEPLNSYNVVAGVRGEVLSDTFNEGDHVEEGDVLYTIDSSDIEDSVEKAEISYEKSLMNYENSQKEYTGLNVTAGSAGRIAELYVEKGDSVQVGTPIAKIVDDSEMTVRVPFSETDAKSLMLGKSVTVTIENTFETISGTITSISTGTRTADGYLTVKDVEVTFQNPGYLKEGTYASVSVGDVQCQETEAIEYKSAKTVKSDASGTVEKIVTPEGSTVTASTVIVKLENEDAEDAYRSSQLTMREAEVSYGSAAKQLEDYTITAPISGSIIEKTIKAGDTIDASDSQMTMAIIADMSQFKLTIYVDELDISQLKEGQEVQITCDALPQLQLTGQVENIGINGTSTNGVTNYPVKIVFDYVEGVLPGMNVTADIIVDSAEDVLLIPSYAVNRGNTVTMADGTEAEVELGLSDENNIEIKSGLKEGDVIQVPAILGSESGSSGMMGGAMMGGMPGGAPSGGSMPGGAPSGGGMPSGGGSGGGRGGSGSGGGPGGF